MRAVRERGLELFDLQREARQSCEYGPVELGLVLLGGLGRHRRREVVAERSELLGSGLDEIEVVPVALLGIVAAGRAVGALRLLAVGDQVGVLPFEEIELAPDDFPEGQMSSR